MSFNTRGGGGGGTGSVSFGRGAAAGMGVWLIGALMTFMIGQTRISFGLALLIGLRPVVGTMAGYIGIHSWFLTGLGAAPTRGMAVLAMMTAIPMILLLLAGVVAGSGRRGSALAGGISVTVGYGSMTLVAFFVLLTMSSGTIDSSGLVSILLTGIGFPMTFGTVGAALG